MINQVLNTTSQNCDQLGRLEQVELRTVWNHEAHHFTQWLAKPENIDLLAKALELGDLIDERCEVNVGSFRADIICTESGTNRLVVIENQLERTDHDHLGKVVLYTAGLEAGIVIWIAKEFTEEHRAALNWLNEHTDDRFDFFGLQIELWRIGNSEIAPRFNIVSQPNNWLERARNAASVTGISETGQLQLEYWQAFKDFTSENSKIIRARKPSASSWTGFGIGDSNFGLSASMNTRDKWLKVSFELLGANRLANFSSLLNDQAAIEKEIGEALLWRELPEKASSYVELQHNADPTAKATWVEQHKWLCEKLEVFHKTFSGRIKLLRTDNTQLE